MEVSAEEIWTGTRTKRIRGRFRATLAGLLELEVLRVRHKEMVEAALEKQENPDYLDDLIIQQGRYQYWVEESSFRLKLKRSLSDENLTDIRNPRTFLDLKIMGVHQSSEDLHSHECDNRRSRVSSGFCESHSDAVSSLSTSLALLSHQSTDSSASSRQELHTNCLLKTKEEHVRKSDTMTGGFSQVVIPEAGFLSVVDLYPDSHWPDISDILQPQVILEPSYRANLKSLQGSEIYCYPSPLHAVALQSPLYAPQSPENKRKNEGCSPGTFISRTSSLPRPDFVHGQRRSFECTHSHPDSPTSMTSVMSLTTSHARLENPQCEEIILKRARGEVWNHTKAECSGITSWSRRNLASLHRTCSVGRSETSSFKSMLFPNRPTGSSESGPPTSSQALSPRFRGRLGTHKNRFRRHTAALTNLNIFPEINRTLCDRTSAGTSVLHHRHSSEVPEGFMKGTSGC